MTKIRYHRSRLASPRSLSLPVVTLPPPPRRLRRVRRRTRGPSFTRRRTCYSAHATISLGAGKAFRERPRRALVHRTRRRALRGNRSTFLDAISSDLTCCVTRADLTRPARGSVIRITL
ncbi:hypothetical protein EVAR_41908_1 [Eumeta japonica]|uniref:Uncharacterized protein n=1 Tax=Eumeta variegata TaxID=151549 RepID=A0A4C1XJM6_EUMVA|nr:hypothetical protein EVAR_41908_1 [Eumeta japonica]